MRSWTAGNQRKILLSSVVTILVIAQVMLTGFLGLFYQCAAELEAEVANRHAISKSSENSPPLQQRLRQCNFQSFPLPQNDSGLPYLSDVFQDATQTHVVFVALASSGCEPGYASYNQKFFYSPKNRVRFLCEFQPGNHKVWSDYVHPNGDDWTPSFSFRCTIPMELRKNVTTVGSQSTDLTVSLYAIHDELQVEENDPPRKPEVASTALVEGRDSIKDIPVCSNLWYQPDTPTHLALGHAQNKKYGMTMLVVIRLLTPNFVRNYISDRNNTHGVFQDHGRYLLEWMEYHLEIGVQHFIVYDNEEEHVVGRLRRLLLPYIRRGIVTYVWFPHPYCLNPEGWPVARGQFAAELSALHRYGPYTRYFGDWDVDEFIYLGDEGGSVPPPPSSMVSLSNTASSEPAPVHSPTKKNLVAFLDKVFEESPQEEELDAVHFRPHVFTMCNGTNTTYDPTILLMEARRCFTGKHHSDNKLIMKADRILHYVVHYPRLTVNWTKPRVYMVNTTTQGLLVHYRNSADLDNYVSDWKGSTLWPLMDPYVPRIKARLLGQ